MKIYKSKLWSERVATHHADQLSPLSVCEVFCADIAALQFTFASELDSSLIFIGLLLPWILWLIFGDVSVRNKCG